MSKSNQQINTQQIMDNAKKLLALINRSLYFILIVIVLLIYSFLVYRIGSLSSIEPDDEQLGAQAQSLNRLKIDQEALSKIKNLEDQNVKVQSLFKDARDNPFQDN